jgi:hypothetical protein
LPESNGDLAMAEKLLEVARVRNIEGNYNAIMPFGGSQHACAQQAVYDRLLPTNLQN